MCVSQVKPIHALFLINQAHEMTITGLNVSGNGMLALLRAWTVSGVVGVMYNNLTCLG
jgi:hypothetical protein